MRTPSVGTIRPTLPPKAQPKCYPPWPAPPTAPQRHFPLDNAEPIAQHDQLGRCSPRTSRTAPRWVDRYPKDRQSFTNSGLTTLTSPMPGVISQAIDPATIQVRRLIASETGNLLVFPRFRATSASGRRLRSSRAASFSATFGTASRRAMACRRILIDGQDIRDVTQNSLRQMMAIMPQDISMFHRSVLENIGYARPDASQADILAAAEMAHCRDFIEALPEGFATMVGDRGVKLSSGQRQRLAIARALLKDAPILLLDEATIALGMESEQAIQAALDWLIAGRAVIAIAHRLSTLRSFDRIIVMDRGRIVDDGSPDGMAGRAGP
jgi:ABC-type phosphate transport system ATPase subunit